jgi:hypothetical protein
MDCLHWRHLLAKLLVTVTGDIIYCTCLVHLGRRDTDRIVSIGQGKSIEDDIARDMVCNITLNIANVNMA